MNGVGDVATCVEGIDEVRRISRYNGIAPTMSLGVIKQRGTNAVAIGDEVRRKLKELGSFLPKGMKMGVITDTTVFIRDSVNELTSTLLLAVILTAVVCYLFLGTISSAFNVILAIPVSLVGFSAQRGYPVEFVLQRPDWGKLVELSAEMRKRMLASGLVADVDSDYNPNMPEIGVYPDRAKAALRGVNVSTIASAVATQVGGLKLLPNKYTDATGHRDDIQVKLIPEENASSNDISKIMVRNVHGEVLPLSEVVTMKPESTLLTITRYARERGITDTSKAFQEERRPEALPPKPKVNPPSAFNVSRR